MMEKDTNWTTYNIYIVWGEAKICVSLFISFYEDSRARVSKTVTIFVSGSRSLASLEFYLEPKLEPEPRYFRGPGVSTRNAQSFV